MYGDNDQVLLRRGCGYNNGMTPNRVTLTNNGGFALAYKNGGIYDNVWSVNHNGEESGCDNN